MGCGCGGKTYARPVTSARSGSQHAPQTRAAPTRTMHAPETAPPKIVQASALAARRNAVVRRQV
jgi:hypothetical protein